MLTKDTENHRWPTKEQLEELKLTKPLRLKAIRTKGKPGSCLTAIQLIFEDDIESPMFDTSPKDAGNEVSTIELTGAKISKIICAAHISEYISNIRFEHEAGS